MRWSGLSGAIRGVLSISSSAAWGQFVTLLAVPLLARLYTAEQFGIYSSTLAVVTILAILGPVRLDSAIQIADEADVRPLFLVALATTCLSSVCGVLIFAPAALEDGSSDSVVGVFVVAVLIAGSSVLNCGTAFVLRDQNYGRIAARNLVRQVGTTGGQIAFALFLPNWLGLALGLALGQSLALLLFAKEFRHLAANLISTIRGVARVKKYWRFPVMFAPAAGLSAISEQVPILFITYSFGAVDGGNLGQALRIGTAPALVVGAAVSNVVIGELSRRLRAGDRYQRRRFLKASRALGLLGGSWLVAMLLFAPLVPVLLGDGWGSASEYIRVTAVSAAMSLVVWPLSSILVIFERAKTTLVLDVCRILLTLGVGILGARMGLSGVVTCGLMAGASALVLGVTWLVILRVVSEASVVEGDGKCRSLTAGVETGSVSEGK